MRMAVRNLALSRGFPDRRFSRCLELASLVRLQAFAGGFRGQPYHDGPQCLIYRQDLLDAAGICPQRPVSPRSK